MEMEDGHSSLLNAKGLFTILQHVHEMELRFLMTNPYPDPPSMEECCQEQGQLVWSNGEAQRGCIFILIIPGNERKKKKQIF